MRPSTKSILDALDSMAVSRDREHILESRATHIIQGAINLINYIKENYDEETAAELERRLLNSIKGQDPEKFSRGIKRLKT
ncbi:MAG: hypothetical protein N2235_01560 [Fischerella sp.]|nr:hypothetical protein [Fischerella sp.]